MTKQKGQQHRLYGGTAQADGFRTIKANLLDRLASNKTKYKRLSLSPIRYAGGKSLAVGHIVEHLPEVKRVISPFFGGGSIEIAIAQELGIEVIGCDINAELANYWHYQCKHPRQLYNELKKLQPTKAAYEVVKEKCKAFRKGTLSLTKLQRAAYFFYNHNLSYGPSYIGWVSSIYLDADKYQKMIERVRDFRANITVTCEPFENLFARYPHDFFYCDPPYFLKSDDPTSKMFAGIYPERNNPIHHKTFDHEQLRNLLKRHKGGFILSYNDCDKSREYYKDYKLTFPSWQYTMGQGETRISQELKNRVLDKADSHIKPSHELIAVSC